MQARYYEDKALAVSVAHPKNPGEALRRMLKAVQKAWGSGAPAVWTDPRRFRRWLESRGILTTVKETEGGNDR